MEYYEEQIWRYSYIMLTASVKNTRTDCHITINH
jgi:hypothetical protein